MNRPSHLRARLAVLLTCGGLVAALFPLAGMAVAASPTVTPATGGTAITADSAAAAPGTGAYTTLVGPSIAESTPGDVAAGTIVLDAPSGFEFLAGPGAASKNTGCNLVLASVAATAASVTLTITGTSSTTACVITFSGIRVRPTVGTPLQGGNISNSGTTGPSGNWGTLTEVEGAPVLSFQTQPSTTAGAGDQFAQQPVVLDQDRFTNPRPSDSITLGIKAGTGASSALLTCTTNPVSTNASGAYTFAGCRIDKSSPSAYVLRATSSAGGTAAESTGISVTPGTATKLGFTVQPSRGIPGLAFAVQPTVAVLDANNNVVYTDAPRSVTLSIQTGGGSLTCNANPVSTSLGLATFANCRISTVGLGDVLRATSSGLTFADSGAFDVADRLAFTTLPSGAVGGIAFTSQPIITIRAGASAAAVHDNATVVTLAIKSGTGAAGAVLTCTNGQTRTAVAGIATFAGCSIDKSSPTGNPYVLVATSPSLTSAESSSFTVVSGAASKVLFSVQPVATGAGLVFATSPAVAITDAGGNVASTGTDSTRLITLSIGSNPASGTLTCTGGLTRAAVAGVATFSGCSIDRAGTGYTLVATSPGLTSATSSAFNVGLLPATLTLTRSRGMITYGETDTFSVQFGAGGANRPFVIQYTSVGIPWTTIANLVTNASGFASMTYTPSRTGYVRAVFAGATDLGAATSIVYIVGVRQTVSLNPHHTGIATISRGASVNFRTTVRPLRMDLAPTLVTFRFYQKVSGTWVLRVERHVATDASGVARTTFTFSSGGNWYVRAYAPRTPYNSISRFTLIENYFVQ